MLTWSWPETPLTLVAIAVLAIVARWLILRAIKASVDASLRRARDRNAGQGSRAERILAAATGVTSARHEARTRTIGAVLRSTTSVVIGVVAALTLLEALGAPLGAIIASAGIGGVALGFGAQSLVKDFLSGIFMIMEDQFGVGDLIDTGEVVGTVEDIGLRVTRIRDASGQVWYVRNGEIVRVGNQSQGWSTATVDVPVAADEDPARVLAVLKEAMDEVYADPKWDAVLLERPNVAGVEKVVGNTMSMRIFAKCAPNQHWGVQRDILERSQQALQAAGVRGPVALPGLPPPPA
nr:mechanosensitive ion channel [Propionibacterium sp.]